jgi:hypothetical protein
MTILYLQYLHYTAPAWTKQRTPPATVSLLLHVYVVAVPLFEFSGGVFRKPLPSNELLLWLPSAGSRSRQTRHNIIVALVALRT